MRERNLSQISHFLGVDYGRSKIGLALADAETRLAFAYAVILNNTKFIDNLSDIIKKENVRAVIIGCLNHNFSRKKEESKKQAEKLGEMIKKMFPRIVVEYQEEMFTSIMARQNMAEKGGKKLAQDDQEAARIILQEWLDHKSY
jgi:putative Holliday junction resolvase